MENALGKPSIPHPSQFYAHLTDVLYIAQFRVIFCQFVSLCFIKICLSRITSLLGQLNHYHREQPTSSIWGQRERRKDQLSNAVTSRNKRNNNHKINYKPTLLLCNFVESKFFRILIRFCRIIVYADMMTLYFTIFLLSTVYEETGKDCQEFFNQSISCID